MTGLSDRFARIARHAGPRVKTVGMIVAAVTALLGVSASRAHSQIICHSSSGPDVIVADIGDVKQWGTVGGITGYSASSTACNIGNKRVFWVKDDNRHPVITSNAYRLSNGRFEQIGMSWVKHGLQAQANTFVCTCEDPGTITRLGIGCSDTYGSTLNGFGLGPRSEVNPSTGVFPYPYSTFGESGDAIFRRLQIHNADLDPALNVGATYVVEVQYLAADDAAAGNNLNNITYMPVQVGALSNGGFPLTPAGVARPMLPAIYAWQEADTSVDITPIDVPGDGRFFIGSKATDLGGGQWHYEYAVLNFNSDRAAQQFRVTIPAGVNVTNIGFHDVDYHSGELFDGTDWTSDLSGGFLTFSTSTFAQSANANALRWGTLYNFRFDADASPGTALGMLTLFRTGSPSAVGFATTGPIGGGLKANDNCGNAVDVGLGSRLFNTANATTDGPAFACAGGAAGLDVWFRFTPTFSGKVRISTCGMSSFDSVIDVHQGCGCGGALGPLVRCSDNSCGTDAKVVVNVLAGTCYLIRVGAADGVGGPGMLKLEGLNAENANFADAVIDGEAAGDALGQAIGAAGDFSDDGASDVIIGEYRSDDQALNAGRAIVGLGSSFAGGVGFSGEAQGDNFGRAVAGGRDFNNDGFDDIVVGAPFNDDNGVDAGKVYCFSGFDHSTLWLARGQNAGDRFGWAVASVGDVNGDGVPDVIVGAPMNDVSAGNAGRAYLLAGQDGSVIDIISGDNPGEQFGASVAGIGDVNDDGREDFAIGAPRNRGSGANAGRVCICDGFTHTTLQSINGSAGDRFGTALAGVTLPVGTQTRTYLAVGAPNNSAAGKNAGAVRLFQRLHQTPACSDMLCATRTINGQAAGDLFGSAVDLGDIKGNTAPELIVGAPSSDANGTGSGAAYVFNAANGAQQRRIVGEAAGDAFGTALAAIGDIDADGKQDYIVGAPANDAAGIDAGRAYLFLSHASNSRLAAMRTASSAKAANAAADEDDGDIPGEDADVLFIRVPRRGDVDRNGMIDVGDVLAIIREWGRCRPGLCLADLNADGTVDATDLLLAIGRR